MARAEPKPSVHGIDEVRAASRCETCQQPMRVGELKLVEAYVRDDGPGARAVKNARVNRPRDPLGDSNRRYDDSASNPDLGARFHHLACAAQHLPYILRKALSTSTREVPEREALEAAIERALSVVDVAEEAPATREEYRRFIEQLREADDDASLMVFADWLLNHADPRGELAAVQRQLAAGHTVALQALEQKLLAAHRDRFIPDRLEGEVTWRSGFVHRLTLSTTTSLDRVTVARFFSHPSFRLLRELAVPIERIVIAPNLPALPATLRVLDLGREPASLMENWDTGVGDLAPLLAGATGLRRLVLRVAGELSLRSATLAELELHARDANLDRPLAASTGQRSTLVTQLAKLEAQALPQLRAVQLHVDVALDDAVAALLKTGVARRLETLGLHGDLTARGVELLEQNRGALQVLDVRGCSLLTTSDHERLRALVPSVLRDERARPVEKKVVSTEWRVKHTRKPEWGIGTVVSEDDAGLEVDFEHAGRKQVRNVELLEDVSD